MVFKLIWITNAVGYVWEWCKDIWYSNLPMYIIPSWLFENDVKIYGIQTGYLALYDAIEFENDVKIYGIQTCCCPGCWYLQFENDVKIYGIQTGRLSEIEQRKFENDVKIYGIQTKISRYNRDHRLRMM